MKYFFALLLFLPHSMFSQAVDDTVHLADLVREALRNNPELKAFEYNRDAMDARIGSVGTLPDPELTYMRDEMPNFRWKDAMYSRTELMQMIPFPGKLSLETDIAEIQAEHAHHDHMEKANELLARLRSMYFELWFAQQSIMLNRENARLLEQFSKTAQTRYSVGATSQQDVLKSFVEIARLDNALTSLRQQEQSARAMIMSFTNRDAADTLGIAVLPGDPQALLPVDSLRSLAMRFRGMLLHDSLSVEEGEKMLSMARKEFLPDFKIGLQYVTMPDGNLRAWTVSAGITLPFMPWSIARTSSKIDEAAISIDKARETLKNSRNMIRANINDLSFKIESLRRQLLNFTTVIVPQSEQALRASMMAYQTGKTDFLMLIDSYRMLVDLSMEKLMLRMQLEQAIAEMKREVGYANIFDVNAKGN